MRCLWLPSGRMSQSSAWTIRPRSVDRSNLLKAIHRPSGDQAGSTAPKGVRGGVSLERVRARTEPTRMRPPGMAGIPYGAWNAILEPSGDQSGCPSSCGVPNSRRTCDPSALMTKISVSDSRPGLPRRRSDAHPVTTSARKHHPSGPSVVAPCHRARTRRSGTRRSARCPGAPGSRTRAVCRPATIRRGSLAPASHGYPTWHPCSGPEVDRSSNHVSASCRDAG